MEMQMAKATYDFSGQVAVVTGAASGIGAETARYFAACGAAVALLDVDVASANVVAAECGGEVVALGVDVTARSSIVSAVDEILGRFGHIDVLVNSAGITGHAPAEEFPEDKWAQIINVNLTGTFFACQAVGRVMLQQGHGTIVNLASVGALVGLEQSVAYCASKGGVAQVTRTLAAEWATRGVRVNAVAPSPTETKMAQRLKAEDPGFELAALRRVPMDRFGHPSEIVDAIVFLSSASSSLVTGHILAVDGGWLAT